MKFSFCTNCRNRLADLQQTLPLNLAQLVQDEEIVLLDYHGGEDLLGWIRRDLPSYLEQYSLRYYRENTANRFFMAHAKNISHLLGQGHVLVNLDADNFLDEAYLTTLRTSDWDKLVMLYPFAGSGGFKGRTAVRTDAFRQAGGYDEAMDQGYGYEEIDLYRRLRVLYPTGVKHVKIDPKTAIETPEALKAAGQKIPGTRIVESNRAHQFMSNSNLAKRKLMANRGRTWGAAALTDQHGMAVFVGACGSLVQRVAS